MLDQRGANGNVCGQLALAFFDRADAVPDFEPGVPQKADEVFDDGGRVALAVERARQEQEDIDVGIRKEPPATVATDGDQRHPGRSADVRPQSDHDGVDQPSVLAQEQPRVGIRLEARAQSLATGLERGAPARRRWIDGRDGQRCGGVGHEGDHAAGCGGAGVPLECVSTS